jgi:anti-sigma factor RsiW
MNECWDEGGLRAYFDRELPPEDLSRIAAHIGACAECHTRYNELAARAARVSSMMGALEVPRAVAPAPAGSRRRWARPAAVAALALAAAAALAFVLIPKRATPPQPVAAPRVQRLRPIQAETPVPEPGRLEPAVASATPAKVVHAKSTRRPKAAETDYYLALDDEPIDMGVVMRVELDSASAVQADVIFDAEGRARAIRPVKQSSK